MDCRGVIKISCKLQASYWCRVSLYEHHLCFPGLGYKGTAAWIAFLRVKGRCFRVGRRLIGIDVSANEKLLMGAASDITVLCPLVRASFVLCADQNRRVYFELLEVFVPTSGVSF